MKFLATLLFISYGLFISAQEVKTVTDITANGGVSVDVDGNIIVSHFGPLPFVAGLEGKNIYKITPDGDVTLLSENVVMVGTGNTIDSQGFIYQGSFQENKVVKLDNSGLVVNSSFVEVSGPVGVMAIENDTILVCSCNANIVIKVAPDGSSTTFASGSVFNCANGITKDDDGNVYTTNFSDGRITKITSDGVASTIGNTNAGNGHIAFRSANQMFYIASYSSNRIFRMDLDGSIEHFAGTGAFGANDSVDPLLATFANPNGIEVSNDGCSLYISQDEDVLREIAFNDSGCSSTGIKELNKNKLFEIFPNPITSSFQIVNNSKLPGIKSVSIYDILGSQIVMENFENSQEIFLNKRVSGGIFLIKITSMDGQDYIKKVVVQSP